MCAYMEGINSDKMVGFGVAIGFKGIRQSCHDPQDTPTVRYR